MLKSRQKSDIFQMFHGGPFTGCIIFHELIDQNPETVAGGAYAQSHPAGRLSFSVAAVNVDAAKLSNIDTDRWGMSFFVVNGLVAGVAGMLMVIRLNSAQPTAGSGLEFQAVVAAVLGGNLMSGGKGSVWGAIMGGLVVYVIRNGLSMAGVNANAIMVITGLILILSMLLNLLLDKDADWRKSPLFRNLLGRKV